MRPFTLSRFSRIGNMPSGEISYLVPGARRFGLSRFSIPGTLQSRGITVTGDKGTLVSTRTPLVAADRNAAVAAAGGYQSGKSYALPDVSGGVAVTFIRLLISS